MSATDLYRPSSRLRGAALAERQRIERELQRLAQRQNHLVSELASVEAAQRDLADQLRALNRFVHEQETPNGFPEFGGQRLSLDSTRRRMAPQDTPDGDGGHVLLRGAAIRQTAVRLLASSPEGLAAIHYRDWYAMVFHRGHVVAGKDPYATFLTQVTRSPAVRRGHASGTYVVDWNAPRRLRERIDELASQLRALQSLPANSSAEELHVGRTQREQLTADIDRAQRDLEEVLRSLGEQDAGPRSAT